MKTPMQILMSEIEDGLKQDEIKVSPKELLQHLTLRCRGLLEKEKEVMCEFAEFIAEDHWRLHNVDYQINLYEWKHADGDVKTTNELFETFNTKEK